MTSGLIQRWAQSLATLVSLAVLTACGGAVGSGGTGAPLSVSAGTVTGFGSIIIDGARFDDRGASVRVETEPGQSVIAEVKLGQQVEADFEVDGVAKAVRIEAQVLGTVSEVLPDGMKLLGQTVFVNAAPASGPVTQFAGGYARLADVKAGDVVEIHGVSTLRGTTYAIQATRAEKKPFLPAYLRVASVVSGLAAAGASRAFMLGELMVDGTNANLSPEGRALANGQTVVVLAKPNALQPLQGGGLRLSANQIRIKERLNGPLLAYLGGVVTQYDAAATTFMLGGIKVNFATATVVPSGRTLANGQYVQVRGSFASDGSLVAGQAKIRDGRDEPEAELKGTLTGFDSASRSFMIRDVNVDAGDAQFEGCPANGLSNGLFVEVNGSLSASGVLAQKVHCEAGEPVGAIVERKGVVSDVRIVDSSSGSFMLAPSGTLAGGGPLLSVQWNAQTFFRNLAADSSLNGKTVEVEGVINGSTMLATKIKAED